MSKIKDFLINKEEKKTQDAIRYYDEQLKEEEEELENPNHDIKMNEFARGEVLRV